MRAVVCLPAQPSLCLCSHRCEVKHYSSGSFWISSSNTTLHKQHLQQITESRHHQTHNYTRCVDFLINVSQSLYFSVIMFIRKMTRLQINTYRFGRESVQVSYLWWLTYPVLQRRQQQQRHRWWWADWACSRFGGRWCLGWHLTKKEERWAEKLLDSQVMTFLCIFTRVKLTL